jgi:hypothetical protein
MKKIGCEKLIFELNPISIKQKIIWLNNFIIIQNIKTLKIYIIYIFKYLSYYIIEWKVYIIY